MKPRIDTHKRWVDKTDSELQRDVNLIMKEFDERQYWSGKPYSYYQKKLWTLKGIFEVFCFFALIFGIIAFLAWNSAMREGMLP